jgi:hypothetical protein
MIISPDIAVGKAMDESGLNGEQKTQACALLSHRLEKSI